MALGIYAPLVLPKSIGEPHTHQLVAQRPNPLRRRVSAYSGTGVLWHFLPFLAVSLRKSQLRMSGFVRLARRPGGEQRPSRT